MNRKTFCAVVWSRMIAFLRTEGLVKRGDRVLVGLSGGPDSVCLLHFLSVVSRRCAIEVAACHVHHGIRGKTADRDMEFSRELCKKLGVRFFGRTVASRKAAAKKSSGLEHAARKLRYASFGKIALAEGFNKIAVGHHLDDHVETIMLNMLRGTNPRGLAGIPVSRSLSDTDGKLKKIKIIRPLLCVKRKEVLEYLKQNNLSYRIDETNDCEDYTRNWVRKKLLPFIEKKQPRFREHMLAMSRAAGKTTAR